MIAISAVRPNISRELLAIATLAEPLTFLRDPSVRVLAPKSRDRDHLTLETSLHVKDSTSENLSFRKVRGRRIVADLGEAGLSTGKSP